MIFSATMVHTTDIMNLSELAEERGIVPKDTLQAGWKPTIDYFVQLEDRLSDAHKAWTENGLVGPSMRNYFNTIHEYHGARLLLSALSIPTNRVTLTQDNYHAFARGSRNSFMSAVRERRAKIQSGRQLPPELPTPLFFSEATIVSLLKQTSFAENLDEQDPCKLAAVATHIGLTSAVGQVFRANPQILSRLSESSGVTISAGTL